MLFQHQSVPDEDERTEPSWLLGRHPGPYINQLSRSLFMSLGDHTSFLGLDCRTERTRDEILSQETYDLAFDRCRREIVEGQTRHLIVLLGVPIAYPRLVWLENVLTSKMLDPIKALGKFGLLGNFLNKFDGGVELLDDLDDHWTAKHHKRERNWFIQELQELAREKSVRITMLSGDVHLAAAGQFFSNAKLGIPKDRDHRYMPNIISSAIVNAPPNDTMADVLNKRNKIHHLDEETDEDMIPLFLTDVDGKSRNNKHMFPRRNWCSISEFNPRNTSASNDEYEEPNRSKRSSSLFRSGSKERDTSRSRSITRRDPKRGNLLARANSQTRGPPTSYRPADATSADAWGSDPHHSQATTMRTNDSDATLQSGDRRGRQGFSSPDSVPLRPNTLTRRASKKDKTGREGFIEMKGSLEITIHCEIDRTNPGGYTVPYTLLVPALHLDEHHDEKHAQSKIKGIFGGLHRSMSKNRSGFKDREPYDDAGDYEDNHHAQQGYGLDGQDDRDYDENARSQQHNNNYVESRVQPREQDSDGLYDADPNHTTASHQRASIDSDPQHSEKTIQRLPRSQAPLEEDPAFFRRRGSSSSRPGSRGRSSTAVGPPMPSNFDRLPLSVQKRYRMYDQPNEDDSNAQQQATSPTTYAQPGTNNSTPGYAAPSSYVDPSAMNRTRRYSGSSMESPILPICQSYLRSSDKRTNFDPALYNDEQGQGGDAHRPQQQQHQQLMDHDRRVASGPASYGGGGGAQQPYLYSQQNHQHTPSSSSNPRDPYAKFLESPNLSANTPATGTPGKIQRHYGVGNNDPTPSHSAPLASYVSSSGSGGVYDPNYVPTHPQSPILHDWAQQRQHQHQRTQSDDTNRTAMTSPLPPPRPLPSRLRDTQGQVLPEKVARHFDDMAPVQGQGQGQSDERTVDKPRGSSISRMIRRLSGTEGKSVWRTEAERQESRERSTNRAREAEQRRAGGGEQDGGRGEQMSPFEQRQRLHLRQQQQPRMEDQEDGENEGVDDGYEDDGGASRRQSRRFKLF